MSLHRKQYKEPDSLLTDPDTMRRHLRLLRGSLKELLDEHAKTGGLVAAGSDVWIHAASAFEETKEL